jgi:hypothetical protein
MSFAAVVPDMDFTERLGCKGMAATTFINHADLAIARKGGSVPFNCTPDYYFLFTLPPF